MEVGEWAFFSGWVHFFKIMVLHVLFATTFASDLTTCIMSVDIVMSACTLIQNLEKKIGFVLEHKKVYHQQMGAIPPGEMPDGFQVHAETIDTGEKLTYHTDDIPMMPDSNGRVFIQLNRSTPTSPSGSSRLASHRRYKATITAQNIAGGTNSTGDIHFSKSVCVLLISSTALTLILFPVK